jgi:hypothetical protein
LEGVEHLDERGLGTLVIALSACEALTNARLIGAGVQVNPLDMLQNTEDALRSWRAAAVLMIYLAGLLAIAYAVSIRRQRHTFVTPSPRCCRTCFLS